MSDRTTLADLAHALAAIDRVLAENELKHRGQWRQQSVYTHVCHARAHLECWIENRNPVDLAHALTRGAMAMELARAGNADV